MGLKILAFGQISDIIGKPQLEFPVLKNTAELKAELEKKYPALKNMNYTMAVNKKTTSGNVNLNENDTIALLPAFSGG
jgi:molybdopterin synthase sulfur carrier subunit